jgi:hypothetical protein
MRDQPGDAEDEQEVARSRRPERDRRGEGPGEEGAVDREASYAIVPLSALANAGCS